MAPSDEIAALRLGAARAISRSSVIDDGTSLTTPEGLLMIAHVTSRVATPAATAVAATYGADLRAFGATSVVAANNTIVAKIQKEPGNARCLRQRASCPSARGAHGTLPPCSP